MSQSYSAVKKLFFLFNFCFIAQLLCARSIKLLVLLYKNANIWVMSLLFIMSGVFVQQTVLQVFFWSFPSSKKQSDL